MFDESWNRQRKTRMPNYRPMNPVHRPRGLDDREAHLAEAIARLVAEKAHPGGDAWMSKDDAIEYSHVARGTFEKLAADGRIPSHGGKTKVFNRAELDDALRRL